MNTKSALGLIALGGALFVAAAAYAEQPVSPNSDGASRMTPMAPERMMEPGMMGQHMMREMMAPSGQMQQMMERCQQMMQSRMEGPEGQGHSR